MVGTKLMLVAIHLIALQKEASAKPTQDDPQPENTSGKDIVFRVKRYEQYYEEDNLSICMRTLERGGCASRRRDCYSVPCSMKSNARMKMDGPDSHPYQYYCWRDSDRERCAPYNYPDCRLIKCEIIEPKMSNRKRS